LTLFLFGVLDIQGAAYRWNQGYEIVIIILVNFTLVAALLSYGISYLMNLMRKRIRIEVELRSELRKSLHEKELLLKELNHRVRNSIQQIMSLIQLRIRRTENPESKESLRDIENRMGAISKIYDLLHQSDFSDKVPADRYIQLLIDSTKKSFTERSSDIIFKTDIENIKMKIEQLTPCGLIINEVITNTFKHAFPKGFRDKKFLEIELKKKESGIIHIRIKDNGIGFPSDFPASPHALGKKLLGLLIEVQLKGSYTVSAERGTEFQIQFPEA
jgi:two-component sensor histidine kinase